MREERQAPRVEERLAVELEIEGVRHAAASRNVSTGGMFVETVQALRVGARVRLHFVVPAQRDAIAADAEVRWTEPSGVGVRFLGMRARDVWAIGKLLNPSGPITR